jgi:hypothetical protein
MESGDTCFLFYQPRAEKQMRLAATLRKAKWISARLS